MKNFRTFAVSTLAIALGMVALVHAADPGTGGKPDAKKVPPAGDGKKPNAPQEREKEAQGLGSFGKVLPLGQKNLDVKIPSFKDGRPDSLVRAASMTRLDDSHMDLQKADIRLYGENRDADLKVYLPSAVYDMSSQIMTSEERSMISRADFQIEGDTLVFDTRSRQGKMTGHIHMIIYNADTLSKKPDASATSAGGKQPGGQESSGKK